MARESRYKHPHSEHWLKQNNNHIMANRGREIQKKARFYEDECREYFRIFTIELVRQIMKFRDLSEFRNLKEMDEIYDSRPAYSGSMGRALYEALND